MAVHLLILIPFATLAAGTLVYVFLIQLPLIAIGAIVDLTSPALWFVTVPFAVTFLHYALRVVMPLFYLAAKEIGPLGLGASNITKQAALDIVRDNHERFLAPYKYVWRCLAVRKKVND